MATTDKFCISFDKMVSAFVRMKAEEDNRTISNWLETLVRVTYADELKEFIEENK